MVCVFLLGWSPWCFRDGCLGSVLGMVLMGFSLDFGDLVLIVIQ